MMMASFSLIELAQALSAVIKQSSMINNGDQQADKIQALRINTDTRTIQQGDIFLALRGDNFDGHNYLEQAQKNGAVAAIVDEQYAENKKALSSSLLLLVVPDTLLALGQASLWNRQKFAGPLIAITGSAGKTSVKSMASHMMKLLGNCWATPGNFNNHIGAPLTLLGLEPQHKAAVIELGASGEGEIAYTAQFAQPDVAILTNVSGAHLEGFGSIETIMRTKGEIIDSLSADGCAILNADDVFYTDWVLRAGARKVLSFGIKNYADIMAKNIICDEHGSHFDVVYQQQHVVACEIPLLGQHNVLNALSAIAAGLALGLQLEKIVVQLKTLPMVDGRLQWVDGEGQIRILNDSYNASPASVKAAIDVLALWKEKAWLVLGDMAELGDDSAAIHAEIGEYAQQKGIAHFVATGTACRYAVEAFTQTLAGQETANRSAHWFKQQSELLNYINDNKQSGQVFLIKGSRSAGMDKIVTALSIKKIQAIKSDSDSLNIIGEV
jgi:UDP-N-acetylmuramoyl-tripeptide--D-alanyl-D-alanine ligase